MFQRGHADFWVLAIEPGPKARMRFAAEIVLQAFAMANQMQIVGRLGVLKTDLAGARLEKPGERAQQAGFSRAIRPTHFDQLARSCGPGEALKQGPSAARERYVFRLNPRRPRQLTRP